MNRKLHSLWQDLCNSEEGCGEIDTLQLQDHYVLNSFRCFVVTLWEHVDAGEVGAIGN